MRRLQLDATERHGFYSRQVMDDVINPYDLREADCSGRALATLVIAWVGAALVASVLLKWTQMWVALAVLTLLFLAACTYAAYDARKTHERALAREEERQLERTRRRQQQLDSISGGVDNFTEIVDPPEYESYWVSDLPPSYNVVIGSQPTSPVTTTTTPVSSPVSVDDNEPISRRLSNPPPYAIAIQTEPLFLPVQNVNQSVDQQLGVQNLGEIGGQTSSTQNNVLNTTPRVLGPAPGSRDEDKLGDEQSNTATVPTTRTQYLASIFNSTFGRTPRRTNNNPEQNAPNGVQNENQNNRNRAGQSVVQNNSTNNDRNVNGGNGEGNGIPSPPYRATRFAD